MANKYGGDYYVIELSRGSRDRRERFKIGMGANGEIVNTYYDGKRIDQYNGLDAEEFASQMTTGSDPKWERHSDYFPGWRR